MLTCFSKYYFGVECPGCGAQRSFLSLLHGDFLESLALYPALIPFMLFTLVGVLSMVKSFKISLKWVVVLAIFTFLIMIIHYILKVTGNAPWYYEAASCFHP